MPSNSIDNLLSSLEGLKTLFAPADAIRKERLLRSLNKRRIADPPSLIRLHEILLFMRAYPQNAKLLRLAERLLSSFAARVDQLRRAGTDLVDLNYIEASGIAGTTITGTFSYDIARWLAGRYPRAIRIDWAEYEKKERLATVVPGFIPLLYEDSLVEANVPYLIWLEKATGRRRDLHWLLQRFESLDLPPRQKGAIYDSLELPIAWDLGNGQASRTRARVQTGRIFYHNAPLIRRNEVQLREVLASPPPALEKLSRPEGQAMIDVLREATTIRYRELYGITHGDPDQVVKCSIGRGIDIFLWGLPAERRLPLRAYAAGFTAKNGVPINYIEAICLFERAEVGFNQFYTFRDGESAWIYARVLRLLKQALGVTAISIDPYQIGFGNDEAVESGAFWFYRKLGFRPTRPELRALAESEETRIKARPGYRSPERVLRRLSAGHMIYEGAWDRNPGLPPLPACSGDWDDFEIRNIGFAVAHRMATRFGGDPDKMRSASMAEVMRALSIVPDKWNEARKTALHNLSLVLALIPDLARWSQDEKRTIAGIIRAKAGFSESHYLGLIQRHTRLRDALIRVGSSRKAAKAQGTPR
jgi:hypothetical protein